ncbi:MAG: transposase [Candidatus Omnitrophota bacterium]
MIRKSHNRLKGYNYSNAAYYYVTICAYKHECLFGKIIKHKMTLNSAGKMVDTVIKELPKYYSCLLLDEHIIMPNHAHMIIGLNQNKLFNTGQARGPVPTQLSLSDIICRLKSLTTNKYIKCVNDKQWPIFNKHLWQRSFYDHIIRNEVSLNKIREYIISNPVNWAEDEENPDAGLLTR